MIRKYNTVYINELGMSKELSGQADVRVTTTRTIVLSLKWKKRGTEIKKKKQQTNPHTILKPHNWSKHTLALKIIIELNTAKL